MKKSDVIKYAQRGDPQAIALLLNHSLKPQGIRTTVSLQAGTLHILLEGQQPPNQTTYAQILGRGLHKLDLAALISKAHIYGRAEGTKDFAWKTVLPLRDGQSTLAIEHTASQSPTTIQAPPPVEEDVPTHELKPGWGFWCGWLMMSLVGSAIAFVAMYYFEGRIERSYDTTKAFFSLLTFIAAGCIGLFVGLGQWLVLRREASWSRPWVVRTATGTFISTVVGVFFGWYYQTVPSLPNATLFWLLMVLPIVTFQWIMLRRELLDALLWLVIPTVFCTLIGLTIYLTLPSPFNLLDAATITRWMFYALGGELIIWLLHQNGLVESALQPKTEAIYRRVVQRRSRFNYWFILEWTGLTLVGWLLGYWLIETLPLASVLAWIGMNFARLVPIGGITQSLWAFSMIVEIPNVLLMTIWIGFISATQWFALHRRLDYASGWIVWSLIGAGGGGLAIFVLKAGMVWATNWDEATTASYAVLDPLQLPPVFELSLPGLLVALAWGASVLAQCGFWQRQQFPWIGWLVANMGLFTFVALFPLLVEDFHLLRATPFIGLILPALAIAWMAAYSYRPVAQRHTR